MKNIKEQVTISIVAVILLAFIDQITKYFVVKNMALHDEIKVLGDALVFKYIRNTGAAWGSFAGKIPILLIFTIVVVAALCYVYRNIARIDRFRPLRICIIAILGGAIGNMIDRIRLGYVVDFIYVKCINFPVFNFADICVTVSVFVMIFLFIFKYKSEDSDIILGSKDKTKETNLEKDD